MAFPDCALPKANTIRLLLIDHKWDHFDLGFDGGHDGKTRHKSSEGPRILVAVD